MTNATPLPTSSGAVEHEVPPEPHEGSGGVRGVHQHAAEHGRADRVQPQGELGDDAEVAPAAAQRPEQVGVQRRGRRHGPAVGHHHLGREQAVAGEPQGAFEPAAAGAEREPADARGGHPAAGDGQPVLLGGGVDRAPGGAAADPHGAVRGVDDDVVDRAQVDAESPLDDRGAGDTVPAAVHRDGQPEPACEGQRRHDVARSAAAHDPSGVAVDHPVEDPTGLVVAGIGGDQGLSLESCLGSLGHVGHGRTPPSLEPVVPRGRGQ